MSLTLSCTFWAKDTNLPTTLKTYELPYEVVWDATLDVVYSQKQLPLIFADKESGVVSSDWIIEHRTIHDKEKNTYSKIPSRYRVNIRLRRGLVPNSTPQREQTTITVNKQMQLKTMEKWKAFPSDKITESAILAAIDQELKPNVSKP